MKELFLILFLFVSGFISAQNPIHFTQLALNDFANPVLLKSDKILKLNYPVKNIIDGNIKSCWVAANESEKSILWMKLSNNENFRLNIFSGYGKNKSLYYQNARPKELRISLYYGLLPEGNYSETSVLYQVVNLHQQFNIKLKDIFKIQTFDLKTDTSELIKLKEKIGDAYATQDYYPAQDKAYIVKIEIVDTYQGIKYKDVCISELFFQKAYKPIKPIINNEIINVYLDKNENSLLIDTKNQKNILIYQDKSSVLQIIEISENKHWAILITMSEKMGNRTETNYLLINLENKKIINNELKKICPDYQLGTDIYFEQFSDKLFLKYYIQDGLYRFVELIN